MENPDGQKIDELVKNLLSFCKTALLPHFRAECECLLTRLVRHMTLEDEIVTRTQRDHLSIETLVMTIHDARDPAIKQDALVRLATTLRGHIRWEEQVLFEVTQQRLTDEEMEPLGVKLPNVSKKCPRLHPEANTVRRDSAIGHTNDPCYEQGHSNQGVIISGFDILGRQGLTGLVAE